MRLFNVQPLKSDTKYFFAGKPASENYVDLETLSLFYWLLT